MADEPIEEGSTGEIDGVPVVYQGGYWVRQPQGIPASTFQRVVEAVPTAIRVGSAFIGGPGGLPGATVAGLGELAAQGAETMLGQRSEFSGKQLAAQTALGAVPMGKLMALRGLKRLPTAARVGVETVGRATGGALVGGVGAGVTALGEGETFQTALERARAAAPVGAGVSVVSPLVVTGASKIVPAVGDLLQGKSQFLQRALKTARETVDPQAAALAEERVTEARLRNKQRQLEIEFATATGPSRIAKAIANAETAEAVAKNADEMQRGLATNQTLSAQQKQQILDVTEATATARTQELQARTNKLRAQTVAVEKGVLRDDAKLALQLQEYASRLEAAKTAQDIRKASLEMQKAVSESNIADKAARRQMDAAIAADARAKADELSQMAKGMTPTQVTQSAKSGGRTVSVTSRPVTGTLAAGEEVYVPVEGPATIQPAQALESAIAEGYRTPFVKGGPGVIEGSLDLELNAAMRELRQLTERRVLTPEELLRKDALTKRVDELGSMLGKQRNVMGKDWRAIPTNWPEQ